MDRPCASNILPAVVLDDDPLGRDLDAYLGGVGYAGGPSSDRDFDIFYPSGGFGDIGAFPF